jgi:hypothetical protein
MNNRINNKVNKNINKIINIIKENNKIIIEINKKKISK